MSTNSFQNRKEEGNLIFWNPLFPTTKASLLGLGQAHYFSCSPRFTPEGLTLSRCSKSSDESMHAANGPFLPYIMWTLFHYDDLKYLKDNALLEDQEKGCLRMIPWKPLLLGRSSRGKGLFIVGYPFCPRNWARYFMYFSAFNPCEHSEIVKLYLLLFQVTKFKELN